MDSGQVILNPGTGRLNLILLLRIKTSPVVCHDIHPME